MTDSKKKNEIETEKRWCNYCISSTNQEIIHQSKISTYKRRRQYRCLSCGKTTWLQGRRPSAESVY